jgi:hypothetical protein
MLQAYDGTNIPNSIDPDPSPQLVEMARFSQRRGGLILAGSSVLGPPTGRYNCHGLVFASRRTNVPPASLLNAIAIDDLLAKDEYERVPAPQVGDIVIYRSDSHEVEHSGFVSRIETIGSTSKLFVCSKWGALEEYEHLEHGCPYSDCSIEYWRLKQ